MLNTLHCQQLRNPLDGPVALKRASTIDLHPYIPHVYTLSRYQSLLHVNFIWHKILGIIEYPLNIHKGITPMNSICCIKYYGSWARLLSLLSLGNWIHKSARVCVHVYGCVFEWWYIKVGKSYTWWYDEYDNEKYFIAALLTLEANPWFTTSCRPVKSVHTPPIKYNQITVEQINNFWNKYTS